MKKKGAENKSIKKDAPNVTPSVTPSVTPNVTPNDLITLCVP